jgi:hypothetical protein
MTTGSKLTGLLIVGLVCLPVAGRADTPQTPHRVHKVKKQQPPPPLPSGPRGPVPQIPLDAMPAVAPQVSYQDGLLTIVAPNSTLSEILKGVRKHTAAEIEIPTANERVATRLGPGPAREVMAELLNGSRFNYILLGSPTDANQLVRVVLVAKTGPDTPSEPASGDADAAAASPSAPGAATALVHHPDPPDASEDTPADDGTDEAETAAAEAEQPPPAEQPGVKTPQQMLQEMQQRQLQMQQQNGQVAPGQINTPVLPGRPPLPQPQQQQQQ